LCKDRLFKKVQFLHMNTVDSLPVVISLIYFRKKETQVCRKSYENQQTVFSAVLFLRDNVLLL